MSDNSTDAGGTEDRRRVVFFVDDNDDIRHTTSRLLQNRGYEVLTAASASEAYEVSEAFEGDIDVLLMDIHLPDAWGATLAFSLRQSRPDMALVFITGRAGDDPVLADGLSHTEFVVTKPVTTDRLVAELERAMAD